MSEETRTVSESEAAPTVLVVGGGVAGLTAGLFTARAGLDVTVVDGEESILARNAFLENFPGFPAGVDARLLLEMTRDQAREAGCAIRDGTVTAVEHAETDGEEGPDASGQFVVTVDGEERRSDYVVCASWSDTDYLAGLDVGLVQRGSKTYVDVDDRGFSGVDGLYAAGRIAEKSHQAVVAAGHGAEAGIAVVEDSGVSFYHDWVAPEGYFTGRGREVPPGCEEIDDAERERREAASREAMREYFADPHPDEPTMHPSVADED
jgi:thioredoxin reductase